MGQAVRAPRYVSDMASGRAEVETIDDAIAAIDREIDRCVETQDACGYFAIVYRAVTARVRAGIAAGEFADGEQMERFDVLFARRYLDACAGWRAGSAIPTAWRVAFEAGTSRRPLVAQHLLLGINAHINLDLGIAAAAATRPGEVEALQHDFEKINDVLAELVDRMQAAIASISPWTRLVDVVGLRFDEAFVTFSLRRARADAWKFATELSTHPLDQRSQLEQRRDADVTRLGDHIVRPGLPLRWMVPAVRFRERHDLLGMMTAMGS
jgi:hypothetical protein